MATQNYSENVPLVLKSYKNKLKRSQCGSRVFSFSVKARQGGGPLRGGFLNASAMVGTCTAPQSGMVISD